MNYPKRGQLAPSWHDKQDLVQQLIHEQREKERREKELPDKDLGNDRFHALIRESETVYEIIDPDGTIKYISDTSAKVIHYNPAKLIGQKIFKFYQDQELEKLKAMLDSVLAHPDQEVQQVLAYKQKSGKQIFLEVRMQNRLNRPVIGGILLSFSNVTSRIKTEEKLNYKMTHDDLTGLPNRPYFKTLLADQYALAKETEGSLAVFMLDFERIKYINDALGSQFGDQMIIKIMVRLKALLKTGPIIGRYSENQLAIILRNLPNPAAYEKEAHAIATLFLKPFKADDYEFEIPMCMGISLYSKDYRSDEINEPIDDDGATLIRRANIALLWAKNDGINRYKLYCSDFSIQNYKQFELRSDFIKAIKQHQFEIYYQPVVALKEAKILVAEALIRWNHPVWGLISPDEFFYLSEEPGSIIELENWKASIATRVRVVFFQNRFKKRPLKPCWKQGSLILSQPFPNTPMPNSSMNAVIISG